MRFGTALGLLVSTGFAGLLGIVMASSSPSENTTSENKMDVPTKPPASKKRKASALAPSKKLKMRRKECSICCAALAANRFPKLQHKDAHYHEQGVCFNCWQQHLASAIEANGSNAVPCPECDHTLDEAEIKKLASSKTYEE
jgi:hypothetical protein